MHVRTHSYKREMAEVEEMSEVMGGRSFRTSRGSSGVRIANFPSSALNGQWGFEGQRTSLTILMSIQLLLLPVKIPNSSGASGR